MPADRIAALLPRLTQVVAGAGAVALTAWRAGAAPIGRVWDKRPGDPVSAVDIAIDGMLRDALPQLYPAAWLSEETADDGARVNGDTVWVVDPIDGTRDFVRGRTGWAVSVALVHDGEPQIAVLAAPARRELWTAARGYGATCNGHRLTGSRATQLAGARVPAQSLPDEDRDLIAVARPNSIALRIAMVAADHADLVATLRWGSEWDVAAAALIATEAGLAMTDAHGASLRFNKRDPRDFGLLCAPPALLRPALNRLASRRALALSADCAARPGPQPVP